MIAKRFWIVVALLAVLYNILRFGILSQRFGIGGWLVMPTALGFVIWIAVKEWNGSVSDPKFSDGFLSTSFYAIPTAVITGALALLITTSVDRNYGWTTFALVPLAVGFQSGWMHSRRRYSTFGGAILTAVVSVCCVGGVLLAIEIEGAICLLMAAALAIPLAAIGGALGYALAAKSTSLHTTASLLLIGLTPIGSSVERAMALKAPVFEITTSIDIAAPPSAVWQAIVEPGRPATPSNVLFRAGVGYPITNHLDGEGPTATRYCDFSTGPLVEPVSVWKENEELTFRVTANPPPMRELSPYGDIHPPHLDGFMVARQGRFKLTPLPNGGTHLEATSWYQHHLWPAPYWRLWSDYLVHRIHEMVLDDVQRRSHSH